MELPDTLQHFIDEKAQRMVGASLSFQTFQLVSH